MRIPLITPLAARDGTVEKDERMVNCYGEQDDETEETRVIKRAGIDEGDAVISGNDIYGQGIFNYDGYLFAMIGDILGYWIYVGGGTMYGGGGGIYFNESQTLTYDAGTTYDIGDSMVKDGQKLYSYIDGNIGNSPDSEFGQHFWDEEPPGADRYITAAGAAWCASPAAACAYYLSIVYNPADVEMTGATYPGACTWIYVGQFPLSSAINKQ